VSCIDQHVGDRKCQIAPSQEWSSACNDTKHDSNFSWRCQPIFKTESLRFGHSERLYEWPRQHGGAPSRFTILQSSRRLRQWAARLTNRRSQRSECLSVSGSAARVPARYRLSWRDRSASAHGRVCGDSAKVTKAAGLRNVPLWGLWHAGSAMEPRNHHRDRQTGWLDNSLLPELGPVKDRTCESYEYAAMVPSVGPIDKWPRACLEERWRVFGRKALFPGKGIFCSRG